VHDVQLEGVVLAVDRVLGGRVRVELRRSEGVYLSSLQGGCLEG
jgi:hypothetical protein